MSDMSLQTMYKKCDSCKTTYTYNPSMREGMKCPKCGRSSDSNTSMSIVDIVTDKKRKNSTVSR